MRIVAISDTHGYHDKIALPKGDVLIHSGDMCDLVCGTPTTTAEQIKSLDRWFEKQDFKKIICVPGNHDKAIEMGHLRRLHNAVILIDEHYEYEGVKFFGSPWTPPFFGAFGKSEKDVEKVYDRIYDNVDVMITHGPPKGILDMTAYGESIGSKALLKAVERVKPKLHVFGHVHYSYGKYFDLITTFYNASLAGFSISDVDKKPPLVFELGE